MKKSVFCSINNEEQAKKIAQELQSKGINLNDISIIIPQKKQGERGQEQRERGQEQRERGHEFREDESYEKNLKTQRPQEQATGKTQGAQTQPSIKGLTQITIQGIGTCLATGQIKNNLANQSLTQALTANGLPENDARKLETALKNGNAIVCIQSDNPQNIENATNIFKKQGARDICTTQEKAKTR